MRAILIPSCVLASLAICVSFVKPAWSQGFAGNRGTAAVVNGETIPTAELDKILKSNRPPLHPLTDAQKKELRKVALDLLINEVLMRQFLAKNAPAIPAATIEKELNLLRAALAKKNKTFAVFLKETKQTEKELREDILARLRWRAYVTKHLPDSLIKGYYETNKVFFDKVFVTASHILIKLPEKATTAKKQDIRGRMAYLRQMIQAGKITFADAAKKYSHCPSKAKGGDIGKFPYKFVVTEPFATAAFALKVGAISEPVLTEFGYHLIKVTGRTKGEPTRFDEVKDLVRDVYVQDVELYQTIIAEQRKRSTIQEY